MKIEKTLSEIDKKIDKLVVSSTKHEEHLKSLSEKINRHSNEIREIQKKTIWIENRIYLAIGVVSVLIVMLQLLVR